jgi:hypothetical protein
VTSNIQHSVDYFSITTHKYGILDGKIDGPFEMLPHGQNIVIGQPKVVIFFN